MMRGLLTAVVLASLAACEGDGRPTAPDDPNIDGGSALSAADDDEGGRPQADNVEAGVTFTHLNGKFRACDGEDGTYSENHFTFTGTSTGDPRLTGRIEVRLEEIVNITEELGPQWGRIVIRDAASGRKKVEGDFNSWGPLDFTQGAIAGRVRDEGVSPEPTSGDGKLIANWRINYHETGAVTAQIGGATTDNNLPAGIWSGKCKGKFTELDIDLGAPAAAAAAGVGRNWRHPRP